MQPAQSVDIPLFSSLSPDELKQVLKCMRPLDLAPGAVLMQEGAPGDGLYIITSGEIEIIKAMGTPEEHLLAVTGIGDIIGEVALLDSHGRRSASARSRGQSTVLQMTAVDFHKFMKTRPALALQMTHIISNRLRAASDTTIRDLVAKNQALASAYRELKDAHEQIIEKEKLEKELEIARQIQYSMLPEQLPEVKGYTFGARMRAARWLGGDFYDFFPLDGGRIAIVVGDVSDKGVPAALFMALTRSLLRAEALRQDEPGQTLRNVDALLQNMTTSGQFVTVLYGILDPQTGRFAYARAGHELPILLRSDESLPDIPFNTGTVLGILPNIPIDEAYLQIEPGDLLLLYSDGATDAIDPEEQPFGRERLAQVVKTSPQKNAQAACDYILNTILNFQQTAVQFDDITLVTVCANPGGVR